MNNFGISEDYRPVPELDGWLRRRVHKCYWKQWRRVRTKVRHLLALGTGKRQAILTDLSRLVHLYATSARSEATTKPCAKSERINSCFPLAAESSAPNHLPTVGEPIRISTTTSHTDPARMLTYFPWPSRFWY